MATLTQERPLPWVVVEVEIPIDFSMGITFNSKCQIGKSLQKAHKALFIPPVFVLRMKYLDNMKKMLKKY